jgi:selenocysteine-specific elongation factor
MALVTDGAWTLVDELDVVAATTAMPAQVVVHIGAAAVPAQMRPLNPSAARLRLASALPLHLGDRLILRDPASRRLLGADVADVHPQPLHRRGDAARVAIGLHVPVSADDVVSRRGICHANELRAAGLKQPPEQAKSVGDWWVHPPTWDRWRDQLQARVADSDILSAGVPVQELRRELHLPDEATVTALVREVPELRLVDGRVRPVAAAVVEVPGLDQLLKRLADDPLDAPDAAALVELGLGAPELAHAARAGLLLKVTDGIYVAPTAPDHAVTVLAELDHPFTVSEARELLGSTRRVVVPLLEHLDASRRTRRLPDGKRLLVSRPA